MKFNDPKIVAEICCNHQGDLSIAKKMIKTAAEGKATVVKFQKRNNKEFLTENQYEAPHPNKMHSFGEPYGLHREFLEFTIAQHDELKIYAESLGIIYSSSVFDISSAKDIISINPEYIKVPSACNNNFKMLK